MEENWGALAEAATAGMVGAQAAQDGVGGVTDMLGPTVGPHRGGRRWGRCIPCRPWWRYQVKNLVDDGDGGGFVARGR
ncbi:hypothetical protein ABT133_31975 [Streptomyces sp. NPDC001835]|uniref:hypothetical protein n=1 Tax=Streptomyces sp. NPDC001835 TaxID=3154528 RepID=UPI00332D281A